MTRLKAIGATVVLGMIAGLGGAVMAAVAVGILDLGRGTPERPSLNRAWIELPEWGVFMSRADGVVLSVGTCVGLGAVLFFLALFRRR